MLVKDAFDNFFLIDSQEALTYNSVAISRLETAMQQTSSEFIAFCLKSKLSQYYENGFRLSIDPSVNQVLKSLPIARLTSLQADFQDIGCFKIHFLASAVAEGGSALLPDREKMRNLSSLLSQFGSYGVIKSKSLSDLPCLVAIFKGDPSPLILSQCSSHLRDFNAAIRTLALLRETRYSLGHLSLNDVESAVREVIQSDRAVRYGLIAISSEFVDEWVWVFSPTYF